MHTDIASKMSKAMGMLPRQMALWEPVTNFIAAGGTEAEWLAVFRAVSGMRAGGQRATASSLAYQSHSAQPADDGPAMVAVPNGRYSAAAPSSPKASEAAFNTVLTAAPHLPPARPPSQSAIEAAERARNRAALSVFDRELTRTGQRWGNVCYSELGNMTDDGEIARAIRMHIGSLRGEKALRPIRELMTPREFALLLNRTRKHAA